MINTEHSSVCDERETVKIWTIEPGSDLSAPETRCAAIETLEGGGVIYLPRSGFELSERERELTRTRRISLRESPTFRMAARRSSSIQLAVTSRNTTTPKCVGR